MPYDTFWTCIFTMLQGDVWAESRMLGFLWHYYACMEGKVYDITEWASCQVGVLITN